MSKGNYYHVTMDTTVEAEDLDHVYQKALEAVANGAVRITILKEGGARAALIAKDENDLLVKLAKRVKVEDVEMSTRTFNCLRAANIKTLGELSTWSADELLARKSFGRTCLIEVQDLLGTNRLALRESQAEMQLEAAE
jgi:DNA-directed RNA polymerase alpha subunit